MTDGYPAISTRPKSGEERLHAGGRTLDATVLDFWRWSASDLLSNATRGVLAEYIVATALGCVTEVRGEWDAYDLVTPSGLRVEVKSSAYLQSWYHTKLSTISFGIAQTLKWESGTNTYDAEKRYQADIYVFCLLAHQEKSTVDPLDLDQWRFYVLPSRVLRERCPGQKSIGLRSLLKLGAVEAGYEGLADVVNRSG